MIYGSVCSGIEAASVAWSHLGWSARFFSEIEPFPRAVLIERFRTVPVHGDFTTIEKNTYAPIDLLVAGTPCQDFSVAGLRAGLGGARGNLTLEYVSLAVRLRPRWLVWENVPGIFSIERGRAFGTFLDRLVQCGYGFAYRVLDAQRFGVPQRRRRVFVVGYLGDWRPAAAVLFEPESLRGDSPPRREAGQRVASPLAGCPEGGSGYRNGADTTNNLIARALNAHGGPHGRLDFETETFIAHGLRADGFDASEDGTGRGTPLIFDPTARQPGWGMDRPLKTDGLLAVAFQEAQTGVREYANSGSLRANGPGHDPVGTRIRSGMSVRRLTPVECERLMGFPDGWTAITYRGKPAADGPRYRALGNSMAVPVMRWLGERIDMVESCLSG